MKLNYRIKKIVAMILFVACTVTQKCAAAPFTRTDDGAVCSWHGNSSNKIALTFDDGPHPRYTEEILDILDEFNVKATFFVVGENAEQYPSLISREINSGHEIGNHTYSHVNLRSAPATVILNELSKTQETIYESEEYRPKLVRPPEGKFAGELKKIAGSFDYKIVLWTVDTRDWALTPVSQICDNVKANVKSGDIILFHDYIVGESPTPEALRKLIPELLDTGFTFVTVSELLGSK